MHADMCDSVYGYWQMAERSINQNMCLKKTLIPLASAGPVNYGVARATYGRFQVDETPLK